ncbi:MAG: GNAT family N-acetyltransferase [Deltaproteobacteria bacterium]|nr:GNAT family N-acetyltransferase [Deltaproteobacteria bacterium]
MAVDPTGEVIGAAWIRCFEGSTLHVGGAVEPELSIGVLPGHRGKGVGGRLLDALLGACRNRFRAIVLSVRADNPAARLYRRIGFEEVARIENRVGGLSLVMRCEIG